jgi:hypothetical protein
VQLSTNLTEKTSVQPVAPKIASMSGRLRVGLHRQQRRRHHHHLERNDTITGGVGVVADLVTPAVDPPFDFIFQPVEDDFDRHQMNVTHRMISLAGAGQFTSRSAAIAIAPAGFPVGEFDAWMEGCSAHQPILGGRPYFAILCLPPYSRILGTVWGRLNPGAAIGGRWLE